jgi:hypothetical protein
VQEQKIDGLDPFRWQEHGGVELSPTTLFSNPSRDRFLEALLGWIEANAERFRPPREDLIDLPPNDVVRCDTRKAFSELGAALRIAGRVPALRERADFRRLAERWVSMLEAQNVFHDVENRLGLFAHCVALFISWDALKPPAPSAIRRRLQRVLDRAYVDRVERSGWNNLDLHYYFDQAALDHDLPPATQLLRVSSLIQRPQLHYVRDIDLYALTHVVFHIADFGRIDPRPILGGQLAEVRTYLAGALALCLAERNWDLAAELVMCRIFLGSVSELDRFAVAQIVAAQDESGFVPPSATAIDPKKRTTSETLFDAANHSSIVSLFLIAADWSMA